MKGLESIFSELWISLSGLVALFRLLALVLFAIVGGLEIILSGVGVVWFFSRLSGSFIVWSFVDLLSATMVPVFIISGMLSKRYRVFLFGFSWVRFFGSLEFGLINF